MACATITITDFTKPAASLMDLLSEGMQPTATGIPGYTIKTFNQALQSGRGFAQLGGVAYLSIQASPSNGAVTVYKGDANTQTDGSLQGKEMVAGDVDVMQAERYIVHLGEIFLRASANNAKINIEWYFG